MSDIFKDALICAAGSAITAFCLSFIIILVIGLVR